MINPDEILLTENWVEGEVSRLNELTDEDYTIHKLQEILTIIYGGEWTIERQ